MLGNQNSVSITSHSPPPPVATPLRYLAVDAGVCLLRCPPPAGIQKLRLCKLLREKEKLARRARFELAIRRGELTAVQEDTPNPPSSENGSPG